MSSIGLLNTVALACWMQAIATAVATVAGAEGVVLKDGPDLRVELPGGRTMDFILIPSGRFSMGTAPQQQRALERMGMWNRWNRNEVPAHRVEIDQAFYLGTTEITQAQWDAVMGPGRQTGGGPQTGAAVVVSDPDHPAIDVSWHDLQEMIRRLNEGSGADLYRLPTEAEWEYACRAGTTGLWSFGEEAGQLNDFAWFHGNTWAVRNPVIHQVGTKRPNPWGLYDMHGNAWEWCQDWYGPNYYRESPTSNPKGPASGSARVLRGGVFPYVARWVRSAVRARLAPTSRDTDIGARLVRRVQ